MVSTIRYKNFKLFKNWQELKIKPITVLIGKNNTGKTAVLKLPTMLSESLKGNINEAIKLEYDDIKIGGEYRDLVYNRKILPGEPLEFEISNNEDDSTYAKLFASVQLPTDLLKEKSELVRWEFFENQKKVSEKTKDSEFKGFLKDNRKFENLTLNYDYIEALRVRPEEEYIYKNEEVTKIGLKGENTYQILINSYNNQKKIINDVSEWYKTNFENWSFDILNHQVPGSSNYRYRFILKNKVIDGINITNTGQGITQALPLITRSYMPDKEPVLIIIEEPESHLHPAAHGNLAQRFVESCIEDSNKKYLIETHSKNFILRIQTLIADPNIDFTSKDVAIYYVDYNENEQLSTLEMLDLDESGEFNKWPEEIFNESYRELLSLKQNQSKRDDSND